jgi:hypothetical protein
MYGSKRLDLSKGNFPLNWGVRGLVRLVVMNVHIPLQAVRFFELDTGLEEAPKSIQ